MRRTRHSAYVRALLYSWIFLLLIRSLIFAAREFSPSWLKALTVALHVRNFTHNSISESTHKPEHQRSVEEALRFNILGDIERVKFEVWNMTAKSNFTGILRESRGLKWYGYSDICVTGADKLRFQSEEEFKFYKLLSNHGLIKTTEPFRSASIEANVFKERDVFRLRGTTLLVQCWRSPRGNPSHFMIAYGKLFSLCSDLWTGQVFDNIVFFQCPDGETMKMASGGFMPTVAQMVVRACKKNQWLSASTRLLTTPLGSADDIICIDAAWVDHSNTKFLGSNDEHTLTAWHNELITTLSQRKMYSSLSPMSNYSVQHKKRTCRDEKRIAIFQRVEGSSLRHFSNLHEVIRTCRAKTPHVTLFTLSSASTFDEAVQSFNSFDVLITPHGSHMINGLFALHRPSIIEVVGTCFNTDWPKGLQSFTSSYEISLNHELTGNKLDAELATCRKRESCFETPTCPMQVLARIVHSSLNVNITILNEAINRALKSQEC